MRSFAPPERAINADAPFEDFVAMLDDEHRRKLVLDDEHRRKLVWALLKINVGEGNDRHAKATDMHYAKATDMHYLLGMLGHDHLEVLAIGPHHHLVTTCNDHECMTCGRAVCPDGHELHFYHDGCPANSCGSPDDPAFVSTCSACGSDLIFASRERGDGLCGVCHRGQNDTADSADLKHYLCLRCRKVARMHNHPNCRHCSPDHPGRPYPRG